VLLLEGQFAAGVATLDAAIAGGPDTAQLRLCRAELRLRLEDPIGAAADAAEAVNLDPRSTPAKAMLGVVLIKLARHADAIACLHDALASQPANPYYRQALAHAEEISGATVSAARTLAEGIALCPGHAGLLGHARSSLGRHEAAAEACAEARKLAPEDPYVRHLVAAAGLSADAGRAAPEYVETVFDGYASRFDAHLINLGYRIPGLMRAELAPAAARAFP